MFVPEYWFQLRNLKYSSQVYTYSKMDSFQKQLKLYNGDELWGNALEHYLNVFYSFTTITNSSFGCTAWVNLKVYEVTWRCFFTVWLCLARQQTNYAFFSVGFSFGSNGANKQSIQFQFYWKSQAIVGTVILPLLWLGTYNLLCFKLYTIQMCVFLWKPRGKPLWEGRI